MIKKRIVCPPGAVKRIAAQYGVCENTVRYALKFLTEGEQPDKIRKTALEEYNGAIYEIRKPSKK